MTGELGLFSLCSEYDPFLCIHETLWVMGAWVLSVVPTCSVLKPCIFNPFPLFSCPNKLDTTGHSHTSTQSQLSQTRRFTIRTFQFLSSDLSYTDEEVRPMPLSNCGFWDCKLKLLTLSPTASHSSTSCVQQRSVLQLMAPVSKAAFRVRPIEMSFKSITKFSLLWISHLGP